MPAGLHQWNSDPADARHRPWWQRRPTTPTVLTYDNLLIKRSAAPPPATAVAGGIAERVRRSVAAVSYEPTGTAGVEEKCFALQFTDMVLQMWFHHGFGLLGVIVSYLGCLLLGQVQVQVVDSSFFKATGLLLAVLLSLRAKNAVSRRQHLQGCVMRMINCCRNILELAACQDVSSRRKLRLVMHFIFCDIAAWISGHTHDGLSGDAFVDPDAPKIEDLPLEFRAFIFQLRSKAALRVSPRPMLMTLRTICDTLFDPRSFDPVRTDEVSHTRRWHRNIDKELESILSLFDAVEIYNEESYTRQFTWLVASLIFIYISLYPWVVQHESAAVLGVTTAGMAFVFYGLNSMTQQLEDPFHDHGSGFNLALTFRKTFADLRAEESLRERCRAFLDQAGREPSNALHDEFVALELGRPATPASSRVR